MSSMSEDQLSPLHKITILGPSRVGKTSIITSLDKAAKEALQGTPYRFGARSPATRQRLNQNSNVLDGAIRASYLESDLGVPTVTSGALGGTDRAFTFEFEFKDTDKYELAVPIDILDYPGGWLIDGDNHIETVAEHLRDSSLLIIPIDALVLMEAMTGREKAAIPLLLAINEVKDRAVEWAKTRNTQNRPAATLLVPVKCEEYLRAVSLKKGRDRELYDKVLNAYDELILELKAENPQAPILYCPIETLGCVSLKSSEWSFNQGHGVPNLHTEFSIIPPNKRTVRGADDLVTLVSQHVLVPALQDLLSELDEKADATLKHINNNIDKIDNASRFGKLTHRIDLIINMDFKLNPTLNNANESIVTGRHELEEIIVILKKMNGQISSLADKKHGPHFRAIHS